MSEKTVKRRGLEPGSKGTRKGRYRRYDAGVLSIETTGYADFSGTQVTVSEGHQFRSSKSKGMKDIGGPFYTSRSYVLSGVNSRYRSRYAGSASFPTYYRHVHRGAMLPTLSPTIFSGNGTSASPYRPKYPPSGESTDSTLNQLGATAIARCKPGSSPADAMTFLGELIKDGIPSLVGSQTWKDTADRARGAGKDYLSLQFGWSPIVQDVKKFLHAVQHADAVMEQYERDAGKVVRRRYEFPTTREVSTTTIASNVNAVCIGANAAFVELPTGTVTRTRETVRRQWFSGAFTYYLPSGYDSRKEMHRMRLMAEEVLGLELTPDVVWNLAPWSWAVDWFSNAGDVVSNLSDFATGGLVMRYGYIMEHSIVTDTITLAPASLVKEVRHMPVEPLVLVTETKKRVQANPYGFGVSWSGLSPFQVSILAALGLSRKS